MAINLDPSSSDLSVQLISKVLGAGWQSWATGGGAAGAGGVLAAMFQTVNTALLTLAAGVMLYTHAIAAQDLARTGQAKTTTWTFLRQATAMMMLAPVPWANGLNILQVLVMLITSWSIGLANSVWSSGVSYVASNGGSVQPATSVYPIDESVLTGILDSAVLAQGLSNEGYSVAPYSAPLYSWNIVGQGPQDGITFGYQVTGGSGSMPPDSLGLVSVQCAPDMCAAIQSGIQSAVADLTPVAQNALSWKNSGSDGTKLSPGAFAKAQSDFATAVTSALTANGSTQNQQLTQQLQQFSNAAASNGWASAGTFFYQLSDFNSTASASNVKISYTQPNPLEMVGAMSDSMTNALALVNQYASNESTSNAASTAGAIGAGAVPGGTCPSWRAGVWNHVTCVISSPLLWVNGKIINGATGGSTSLLGATGVDAISGIQTTCNEGIDMVEQSFGGYLAVMGTVSSLKSLANGESQAADSAIPIFGSLVGGAVKAATSFLAGAKTEIKGAEPFALSAIFASMALMAIGAFYLPIMPAIFFNFSVIGWLILVLELLLGAPLFAFSHVLPEGDGMIGQSAKSGYYYLLDILARPTLMIFGLFLTILVMNASVSFMAAGLQLAFASEMHGKIVGVVSALAELAIVMGAIYVATNKSVHLISKVPSTVMRWLGHSMGVDSGSEDYERQTNIVGAAKIGSATKSVGSSLAQNARDAQAAAARDAAKAGENQSGARQQTASADMEAASSNTQQSSEGSPVEPE